MKLGTPTKIQAHRIKGSTQFRIQLSFAAEPKQVEFDVTVDVAMMLSNGFRELQAFHKIPIHPRARPSGKPKLVIVKTDE